MIRLVYTTFPSLDVAQKICGTLVEERLIACANILSSMTSIYRWEGKIQTENEVSAILKTTEDRIEGVCGRVEKLHPYECPCFVTLPTDFVSSQFAKWISSEVP